MNNFLEWAKEAELGLGFIFLTLYCILVYATWKGVIYFLNWVWGGLL